MSRRRLVRSHNFAGGSGTGEWDWDAPDGHRGSEVVQQRGLAVLYAGAASPAVLRRAGLLTGGDDVSDAFLQAATAGPVPALLDYF